MTEQVARRPLEEGVGRLPPQPTPSSSVLGPLGGCVALRVAEAQQREHTQ